VDSIPQNFGDGSHVGGSDSLTSALVELLRQVPPLPSEEPETILRLFTRLEEIHGLGLTDDIVTRILPLILGGVLTFLGDCLNKGVSWEQCKTRLLDEFFPHFVHEKLIWDLTVCNFHEAAQSLHTYIDQVFTAASFLGYNATEQQLVDHIVMNFHPTILAQAAFLERPRSRKKLYRAVGLTEEKFSFMKERQQIQPAVSASSGGDPRLSWHVLTGPNVGIVVILGIPGATATRRQPHRETGSCPEVVRPPGESPKWISKNCRDAP